MNFLVSLRRHKTTAITANKLDRGERGEVPIERGGGGPDVRDGGRVLVRAPRDEALVGLDVEEEQHVADVRARGVPGASFC